MSLKHAFIVLESEKYNRNMLKEAASISKNSGNTFEVLFFLNTKSKYTFYNLINIHESQHLSRKLGAFKYHICRTDGKRTTTKKLISLAREKRPAHVFLSGADKSNSFIFNTIKNELPLTSLTLSYHNANNPFKKGKYEPAIQGYLVQEKNKFELVVVKPSLGNRTVSGLFFRTRKNGCKDGLFLYLKNDLVEYIKIESGDIKQL